MAFRRVIEIAPKQLRSLVLLMLILPLVPTGLLVRLLWEEQRYLKEDVADEMRSLYRVYLATALDGIERKVNDAASVAGGLRRAFGSSVRVRVLGPRLETLFIDAGFDSENYTVSSRFEVDSDTTWLVELSGAGADIVAAADDGHIENGMLPLVALLGLVLLTTGMAGFTVSRRLRLEEMQNDSLAAISHELKTPVSSMRVLLETLADDGVEDREMARDYLLLLLQENHRIGHLVEDFLNHTRLEQRAQKFRKEAVEPKEIADAALEQVAPKIRQCGGRIRCFGQGISAPLVFADAEAMSTVLEILLDNALKYSPVDRIDIELDYFESGRSVFFLVKDRGIGVPRAYRRKIFDKFYQANPKLSRLGGGCGLGLSIARHLVEAHGGKIECRGRRGKGCVFCVQIPAIAHRVLPNVA